MELKYLIVGVFEDLKMFEVSIKYDQSKEIKATDQNSEYSDVLRLATVNSDEIYF